MSQEYIFNPEDYGFEPAQKFPELNGFVGHNSYVKVTAKMKTETESAFWYISCHPIGLGDDQRWAFLEASHKKGDTDFPRNKHIYMGLISSHEYAEMLLLHLLGTTSNESVNDISVQRLNSNINASRFD